MDALVTRGLGHFLEQHKAVLEIEPERIAPNAAFEGFRLASGILQDRFISIWPLIEDLALFDPLAELVGREIQKQCRDASVKLVVGCTVTVRHMLEAVRPFVAPDIAIDYLGNYPLLPIDAGRVSRPARRALVFTDVLSTGQGVEDTIGFLASNRIPVARIMALVWAQHQLGGRVTALDEDRATFRPVVSGGLDNAEVPLIRYIDIAVSARRLGVDERETGIPVDPDTVLPQPQLRGDKMSRSLIELSDELNAIAAAGALRVGYFSGQHNRADGSGHDRFTLGFDTGWLIEKYIDFLAAEICSEFDELEKKCGEAPILVTTPSRENRAFISAALRHDLVAARNPTYALFSRTDDFDGSYTHILLTKENTVRNKPAIILLATIQSAETVRALSAVLSLHNCRDVSIVCVLNRANPASASFLARVLRLEEADQDLRSEADAVAAVDPDRSMPLQKRANRRAHEGTYFELISLLRVWDLSASDLMKMEALAHAQFRRYWARCRSEVMRHLSSIDIKYFEPQLLSFRGAGNVPGEASIADLGEDAANWTCRETIAVSLAAKKALIDRKFGALIDLIDRPELSKDALFSVYRYLLADPGALGANRHALSEAFVRALRSAAGQIETAVRRIEGVDDPDDRSVGEAVTRERRLLVGVGLFSQILFGVERRIDADSVRGVVLDLFSRFGRDPMAWSLIARLCDIEWCYACSFAYLLLDLDVTDEDESDAERGGLEADSSAMVTIVDDLEHIRDLAKERLRGADNGFPDAREIRSLVLDDANRTSALANIVTSISELIVSLSPAKAMNPGECIAAVRRELTWPRPKHTYAATNFETCPGIIAAIYDDGKDEAGTFRFRAHAKAEAISVELNHLIVTATRLQNLNENSRRIISVSSANADWAMYFVSGERESLEADVRALVQCTQGARNAHEIRAEDFTQLAQVCKRIETRLWDFELGDGFDDRGKRIHHPTSKFFAFISDFECGLSEMLKSALTKAHQRLTLEPDTADMCPPLERFATVIWDLHEIQAEDVVVLGDRTLFISAFENFISNFRYSRSFGPAPSVPVIGEVTVTAGKGGSQVQISFRSDGGRDGPRPARSTTDDHQRQLNELNCQVEIIDGFTDHFEINILVPQITRRGSGARS